MGCQAIQRLLEEARSHHDNYQFAGLGDRFSKMEVRSQIRQIRKLLGAGASKMLTKARREIGEKNNATNRHGMSSR